MNVRYYGPNGTYIGTMNPSWEADLSNQTLDAPDLWQDRHGSALYRYALLRLRDPDKAEEAVQDTLVAGLQAFNRFNGGSSVRTWLIGILKHKILDEFRHAARMESVSMTDREEENETLSIHDEYFDRDGNWREPPSYWGNPEDALQRRQMLESLQCCLDALPARLRQMFIMRELMGESTECICKEMSISPTNLWTMLYRARMGLRQCLDQKGAGCKPE